MNDIVKTSIKTKLESAMARERLKPSETARIFGIHPNYVSMIKNPDTWMKCPNSAWESILTWVNSGQGLIEWSEKHGKVLPEKHEPMQEIVISKVPGKKAVKTPAIQKQPFEVKPPVPEQQFTDTARLKVALDIEINLVVNGQKVKLL
jgi:hypothetical protein